MSYLSQHRATLGTVGGKQGTKSDKDLLQDALVVLLREEDNKYCADCDAKSPRWASWNIGVFLCIRCAGIHRKLGVHISRVKSVNLDSWTAEQVAGVAAVGNTLARAAYEANLPNGFRRPNSDAGMEQFIKAKYEERRYLIADFKPPKPDPSAVYSLLKSPAVASQQQQQHPKLVLPRPPQSQQLPSSQPPVQPQPPQPQPPQPPPDLLLIGEEGSFPAPAGAAASPDSDFGSFASPSSTSAGQQLPRVNPDLIFDDNGAGGWPDTAASESPKKSAKDSIMALYGAQSQQQQQQQMLPPFYGHHQQMTGGGMHYSASSPMLIASQQQQQHYQQQHQQHYQHQQPQQHHLQQPGLYSQFAGTLIYSTGQQQQQHSAATSAPVSSAGNSQAAYLQQIQSQMANMATLSGTNRVPQQQQQQQQRSAVNDFPDDIWK